MNIPGDVVAYDTKTGKMLWRFNIIPRPGEEGSETWLTADPKTWDVPGGLNAWAKDHPELREKSNRYTGNAGFWAPATADPELGMFYIPTESPTSDFYGGYRPGNNLYANSVLALNAKTGKRVWHFQTTHHDIWDFDPPTAPILADITADGRPVKAVIQLTKQGFAFVLDRVTGKPVWPIEERPVPKSDVPGEWTSPTQPFPTKPVALVPQGVTKNDLVDFTPEHDRRTRFTLGQPGDDQIREEHLGIAGAGPNWALFLALPADGPGRIAINTRCRPPRRCPRSCSGWIFATFCTASTAPQAEFRTKKDLARTLCF